MNVDKIRNGRSVEEMAEAAGTILFAIKTVIRYELDLRNQLDHPSGYAAKWLSEMVEKIEGAEGACALLECEYEKALKEAEDADS